MVTTLQQIFRKIAVKFKSRSKFEIIVQRDAKRIAILPADLENFAFKNGDKISVKPARMARSFIVASDSTLLVPTLNGRAMRLPATYITADYAGFDLPVHLVILTGAGPETLAPIGQAHIANYQKFMGLDANMSILEIGCGIGRDALQLLHLLSAHGRYVGIDVTRESIVWCQQNITRLHPNFEFHHFDAHHEIYNPTGQMATRDFRLPVPSGSVDRIMLGSVFTHLFEDEIAYYLREIRRVLKPSGLVYATFFLYSDATIASARKTDLTPFKLTFAHQRSEGCYYNDINYPTGAIAYTDAVMQRMISQAGLRLTRPYLKGWWSGVHEIADDGQEVAILGI